jgi:ABC-type multidrug transport system fused ATPase/permease subunit
MSHLFFCRLSTIRNADQIAVLSGGRVAELGTYQQLAKKPKGLFRQLIDKQTLTSFEEESF